MTVAEAMAVAVLKGDLVAARALADHLIAGEAVGMPISIPEAIWASLDPTEYRLTFRPPAEGIKASPLMSTIHWLFDSRLGVILPPGWRLVQLEATRG